MNNYKSSIKKVICFILLSIITLNLCILNVSAEETVVKTVAATNRLKGSVILFLGSNTVFVDRVKAQVDSNNSAIRPIVVNGHTLLPLKFVAECFGATVNYDENTERVAVNISNKQIEFIINQQEYFCNGTKKSLEAPAQIFNERTFIPLRALAEAIGKNVFWDERGLIIVSDTEQIFNPIEEKPLIDLIVDLFNK
jgi:hypothetical protein